MDGACPTHDLVQLILNNHPNADYFLSLLIRHMDGVFSDPAPSSFQRTVCGIPRKIPKSSIMMEWNDCKENTIIKCVILVAIILDSFEVISHFGEKGWKLLQAMYTLAKSFHRLKDYPILFKLHEVTEKNAEANPGLSTIVDASFSCFVQKIDSKYDRLVLNPSAHRKVIEKYQNLIDEAYIDLATQTLVYILRSEQRRFRRDAGGGGGKAERTKEAQHAEAIRQGEIEESSSQTVKPEVKGARSENGKSTEEKETESTIKSVIQKLDLVKMKEKRVAVVIGGDSSENKTILADDAYDRVEAELLFRGWKVCAQKIPESLEFNPNVKELRSYIVGQLATGKVKKKSSGKQSRIIHERVFIFIDNILRAQDLRKMLDMELMRRMKVRLLITSANKNLKSLLEGEGFHYEDEEAPHKSRQEYPQLINNNFKDYTVFLEMVEYYDRRQDEENFRELTRIIVKGDLIETAFNFASEIAFLNLPATARDAFLDICSFSLGWDWNEILLILGEAELETLEENALVKRNCENQITVPQVLLDLFGDRAKRGRFTKRDELQKAFSSSETTKQIKGIWVEDTTDEQVLEIPLDAVSNTLRVLSLGRGTVMKAGIQLCKKLRFLQVRKSAENFQLDVNKLNHNMNYFDCGKEDFAFDPSKLPGGLKILKLGGDAGVDYHRPSLHDSDEWIEWELQKLKVLKVKNFEKLGIPDPRLFRSFDKLRELSIRSCTVLEIPESLTQMNFLQKLDLHDCKYLRKLPESFGALLCLEELNLSYCSSLRWLPKSFGQLQSLKDLVLSYCSALKDLPSCFVWLSSLKKAVFSNCHHIQTLPDKFELLSSLEEVDFSYCKRLKLLPPNFHLLSSLNRLNLHGCSKLEKLPYSYPESLVKSKSVAIKLSRCSSLSDLPEEFCEGNKIEDLSLAYCTGLNKLPSHIGELRQLKMLNLTHCIDLRRLPRRFRELACLEVLNLSFCVNLRNLCDGFNGLRALKDINLSNCRSLKGKWMYKLQRMKSLRVVDIRGCPQFKPKGRCHFTVLSDALEQDKEILQNVLNDTSSIFFKDKVSLLSLDGRPFFPSKDMLPDTVVAFIFYHNISRWDWEMLEENVDKSLRSLLARQVIYVGRSLSALPPKLVNKIAAYTPDYSNALSLFDRCLSVSAGQSHDFWESGTYIIETKVVEDPKGFKHFQGWESASHYLMGKEFNTTKYRLLEDSILQNIEKDDRNGTQPLLLQQLLMTKEDKRLSLTKKALAETEENMEPNAIQAMKQDEVSISEFQQSIVFLLISTLEISVAQISFLEEMYRGMQNAQVTSGEKVNWVWVPVALPEKELWESKYNTVAESMPWVVISDPWMMEQSTVTRFFSERMGFYGIPVLVSLAPWGPFSTTNVIPMVTTMGSNAWVFLKKNRPSNSNSNVLSQIHEQSHLSNLFGHVKGLKEMLSESKMVWLYGGDPKKISDFNKKLKSVREKIDRKTGIQFLYVGRGRCLLDANSRKKEAGFHEENEKEAVLREESDKLPWSILSLDDMKMFWHHMHYLLFLVASKKDEEKKKLESIQRLLLALLSLDCLSRRNGTVWMMAIDNNKRDLFAGRGKELVETLASNIKNLRKSSVAIANGVVEVVTKKEGEEGAWIELQVKGKSGEEGPSRELQVREGDMKRFEDALWLTAHPSSQIVEQVSANNCCSMCFDRDPTYQCDRCGWFGICRKCYISHFIGRISKYVGMQKGERAGEITVEVGQHYTS